MRWSAIALAALLATPALAQQVPNPLNAPTVMTSGFYYGPHSGPAIQLTGPSQNPAALLSLDKTFDTGGLPAGQALGRPTLYSTCKLNAIGTDPENKSCRGIMAEGIDNVGGYGTFVEGGKFVGISSASVPAGTGGAYGVIGWAQSVSNQLTVGIEAQTMRTGGADAPGPYTFKFPDPRGFNPAAQATVGFLHSNGFGGVGKRADVGFLVNPYNPAKTSTGFGCGAGSIESTAGTCFVDFGGGALGMDLSVSGTPHTLGSILLSNQDPIMIKKTDASFVPALYVGTDDALHVNQGTTSSTAVGGSLFVGGNLTVTPGAITTSAVAITPTTVAALPACVAGTDGWIKRVTDANAPAWNATVAAGGAVKVLVMCDGANWKVR